MKYETSQEAAKRLNVTTRAIQKWAKEGKIKCAVKQGRDWLIPSDSERLDGTEELMNFKISTFPMMHSFLPGKAKDYIDSIQNKDLRAMALAEYYYFTGELEKAEIILEPYADNKNDVFRFSSAVFAIFCNLSRGYLHKAHHAQSVVDEYIELGLKSENSTNEAKAVCVFTATIIKLQLQLDIGEIPEISDYIKYMSEDMKMISFYLLAYKAYAKKDYSRSIGIVEAAIAYNKNCYPLVLTYLYIIAAMDYICLVQIDKAKESMQKAWEYAFHDKFFMPFVEHYSVLQGLVESFFKKEHPIFYSKIVEYSKQYNESWFSIYNNQSGNVVADNLTHIEFTIAMLYSRNWRVKEIASHMELSERTITNYIQIIYEKLHINSKKQLEEFMLA